MKHSNRSQSDGKPPKSVQNASDYDTSLRLPRHEVDAICKHLDSAVPDKEISQRHYRRWEFREVPVTIKMIHPGGMATTLQYASRNLSNGGLSVLHSSYVYPGTRCVVTLPHHSSGSLVVHGAVTRCRHCKGKIHEIGIKFDETVDVRRILEIDTEDFSMILENVKPELLSGSVLVIDDSELDRVLVRRYLKETNLNIVTANDSAEGLKRIQEGFDIIISDFDLPDFNGIELLQRLRADRCHTPFILVSAEANIKPRIPADSVAPDSILSKPYKPQHLIGAIAQFLLADEGHGAGNAVLHTCLSTSDQAYTLVPQFVNDLKKYTDDITLAMTRGDTINCRRLAFQIKGCAGAFGFPAVEKAAEEAYKAIVASGDIEECHAAYSKLLAVCSRVRNKQTDAAA